MPKCMVIGCTNRQTKNAEDFSLHRFPYEHKKAKAWLLASGDYFENIDAVIQLLSRRKEANTFRVCSDHFSPDCFIQTGKKKKYLKPGAVPTIFHKPQWSNRVLNIPQEMPTILGETSSNIGTSSPIGVLQTTFIATSIRSGSVVVVQDHDYPSEVGYIVPNVSKICNRAVNTVRNTCDKSISTSRYNTQRTVSTQTKWPGNKRDASTSTIDLAKKHDVWTWTGVAEEKKDIGRACSTKEKSTEGIILDKSHILQSCPRVLTHITSPTSVRLPCAVSKTMSSPVPQMSSVLKQSERASTMHDPALLDPDPEIETSEIGELSFSTEPSSEDLVSEKKFIVFESCLDELLRTVQICTYDNFCNAPIIYKEKVVTGSLLTIYSMCEANHRCLLWRSQPMLGRRSCGNILASAAILFSGLHFTKVSELFKIFGVPFISESVHYIYQKKFLFPIIDLHHQTDRKAILNTLRGKAVRLCGAGQCDSADSTTKCYMYTLLEEETKKIVEFNIKHVSGTTSSVATESETFTRCMDKVIANGLKIAAVVTDLHVGIRKVMRENYLTIKHQFDVWHYCKKMSNKLTSISKHRMFKELAPWNMAIVNHLWTSCCLCQGDVGLLQNRWRSLIRHVVNEHTWESDGVLSSCDHAPITESNDRPCPWLKRDTVAYSRLCSFVTDPKTQKDLPYLADFCHTGDLEVYHNVVLKYRPNRVHFSIDGVVARTKLAVLAYNANVNRKQAAVHRACKGTAQSVSLRYQPFFPKRNKNRQGKEIHNSVSTDYLFPMLADVLKLALQDFVSDVDARITLSSSIYLELSSSDRKSLSLKKKICFL
ncbi:uncharacterized protein LOC134574821 [Pelobates fuscus]|uniref:uncharacterized protein LOC134574821 n=1 Tax=Pelobates fuscus TaxID=191477 RepID=UPI002FE4DA6F